ncbi:MAG: hypothetical protein E7593_00915 [Ruminococcaceae bacterium]|nr:hypothetical protein [Oscillospiraceae bacterium]
MNDMQQPDFSFLTKYDPRNLTLILSGLFIGVIIASLSAIYRQLFLGGIVRNILSKNATSPDAALTLEQLGYKKNNIFIKFALRKNSTFRKTVHSVESADNDRLYYIPQEIAPREEIRFRKKGNSPIWLLIGATILLVVAFIALTVIPYFIEKANNVIS